MVMDYLLNSTVQKLSISTKFALLQSYHYILHNILCDISGVTMRNFKTILFLAASVVAASGSVAQAQCSYLNNSKLGSGDIAIMLGSGGTAKIGPKNKVGSGYRAEGTIIYNRSTKTVQVCDGSDWVEMGASGGGDGGGGEPCISQQTLIWGNCRNNSNPTGAHGDRVTVSGSGQQGEYPGWCENTWVVKWSGMATFECDNGNWALTGSSNCDSDGGNMYYGNCR
jgi:hypothetical protein